MKLAPKKEARSVNYIENIGLQPEPLKRRFKMMVLYNTRNEGWRMWGPIITDEEASSVFEEPLSLELLTPDLKWFGIQMVSLREMLDALDQLF